MYLSIFSKSLKIDTLVDISCSWLADFCWYMLSPFLNHMEYFLWCIFKENYFEPQTVSFLELRSFSSSILVFFWSLQLSVVWAKYNMDLSSVDNFCKSRQFTFIIRICLVCFFFNSTDVFSDFSRGDSLQPGNTKSHCG